MGSPSDLREINYDDLPPYSGFSVEEKDNDVRAGVRVAVGFIIAGLFIFIKEALSATLEAVESHTRNGSGLETTPQTVVTEELADLEPVPAQAETQKPEVEELPEPAQFSDSGLAKIFSGRGGLFDPDSLATGKTSPLLLAQNDNIGPVQSGSINPILTSEPGLTVLPNLVQQGSSAVGRAQISGDALVFDPDDTESPYPDHYGYDDYPGANGNRAPVSLGPITLQGRFINQTTTLFAVQLLLLSADADGDYLVVTNLSSSSGTLFETGYGQWQFTPDIDFTGEVTFTYDVSDGEAITPQLALLRVSDVPGETIVGTTDEDVLIGTAGHDNIAALDGNDVVHARAGDDLIRGGEGDDRILGGDGDDTLYGDDGDDIIFAGDGDDVVFGGAGNDTIFGEDGEDSLFGESGDDRISGGSGDDIIAGGEDNDHISGDDGNDFLDGGDGRDTLSAGEGNDIIIAGNDDDIAEGGGGDDHFLVQDSDGNDTYDGGDGQDTYDASETTRATTVNLADNTALSEDGATDTITNFENVLGGLGDDHITGDAFENQLGGGGGNDTISANHGDDILFGGYGRDTLRGDDGDDLIYGGNGDDRLDGEDGNDLIIGNLGNDRLDGEDGDDVLFGGSGNDRLRGEEGDDLLFGGTGSDNIKGHEGNDTIVGEEGNDWGDGGDGDDTFLATVADGDDFYIGGQGIDTYDLSQTFADAQVDLAAGTAVSFDIGSDQIIGFENVRAGAGNDTLMASNGVNVFVGGEGNDTFVFRSAEEAGLRGNCDRIDDYEIGDTIDVSFIDADEEQDGNQDFDFVLDTNEHIDRASLVLRYEFDEDSEDGINTILAGYANDDEFAEFEICLRGRHEYDAITFNGVNVALIA